MGRGQGGARDRASGFASGPHAGAGCAEPVRIAMARHGAGMLGWLPQSPFARRSIGCGSRLHRTRLALLIEILIVLVLIVINGLFAMSELAVVSARPARLKLMAERGNAGARRALDLASDSGRFLSSVQIGITLVGVLSGAFSGATLGVRLAGALAGLGVAPIAAQSIGVGGVVLVITYLSLIVGELVPKQIALRSPEAVAARVAGPMHAVSRAAAPLVWILDRSGRLVLRLLGQAPRRERGPSDEEIRLMIREARDLGAMAAQESEMIASVMRLADRNARGLMTPRSDVDLVDLAEPAGKLLEQMRTSRRSRLPVRLQHAVDPFLSHVSPSLPIWQVSQHAIDTFGDELAHKQRPCLRTKLRRCFLGLFGGPRRPCDPPPPGRPASVPIGRGVLRF